MSGLNYPEPTEEAAPRKWTIQQKLMVSFVVVVAALICLIIYGMRYGFTPLPAREPMTEESPRVLKWSEVPSSNVWYPIIQLADRLPATEPDDSREDRPDSQIMQDWEEWGRITITNRDQFSSELKLSAPFLETLDEVFRSLDDREVAWFEAPFEASSKVDQARKGVEKSAMLRVIEAAISGDPTKFSDAAISWLQLNEKLGRVPSIKIVCRELVEMLDQNPALDLAEIRRRWKPYLVQASAFKISQVTIMSEVASLSRIAQRMDFDLLQAAKDAGMTLFSMFKGSNREINNSMVGSLWRLGKSLILERDAEEATSVALSHLMANNRSPLTDATILECLSFPDVRPEFDILGGRYFDRPVPNAVIRIARRTSRSFQTLRVRTIFQRIALDVRLALEDFRRKQGRLPADLAELDASPSKPFLSDWLNKTQLRYLPLTNSWICWADPSLPGVSSEKIVELAWPKPADFNRRSSFIFSSEDGRLDREWAALTFKSIQASRATTAKGIFMDPKMAARYGLALPAKEPATSNLSTNQITTNLAPSNVSSNRPQAP